MPLTRVELHQLSGLRPIDYEVLTLLTAAGAEMRRPTLAAAARTTLSHLAKTLAGLERRGYVRREWRESQQYVRVTDPGWETWKALRDLHAP